MSSDLKKYIFDTETTIPDKNIDTVYELIMKWLTENNIQVTSEKRPSIIEARHGKKILWTFSSEKMEKKYIPPQRNNRGRRRVLRAWGFTYLSNFVWLGSPVSQASALSSSTRHSRRQARAYKKPEH